MQHASIRAKQLLATKRRSVTVVCMDAERRGTLGPGTLVAPACGSTVNHTDIAALDHLYDVRNSAAMGAMTAG